MGDTSLKDKGEGEGGGRKASHPDAGLTPTEREGDRRIGQEEPRLQWPRPSLQPQHENGGAVEGG